MRQHAAFEERECLACKIHDGISQERASGASTNNVLLEVKAPQAWLPITHDGPSQLGADAFLDHSLTTLGAEMLVQLADTGVAVNLAFNGRCPVHTQYLVPEGMHLIP